MKPQPPDSKYRMPDEALPLSVRGLWQASNRPVVKPECLYFREAKPTFKIPEMTVRGRFDSWGPTALEHRLYYLWQGDGSLAVYAYLFDGSHAAGLSYGCLYVGCVRPQDWTLGGEE